MFLPLFVVLITFHAIYGDDGLINREQRILQGVHAKEGEFPFITSLRFTRTARHYCSGIIITKNWVLSSAFCCLHGRHIFLNAGSIYLDHGGNNYTIQDVIIHERFSVNRYMFDVCLLQISFPFEFDKNVQQAILQNENWMVNQNDKYSFAGWGRTKWEFVANRLKKLEGLTPITPEDCEKETWFTMYPGFICIRSEYKEQGICNRDNGGPLIYNDTVVGFNTFTIFPCRNGLPNIMTSIPFFLDWIKEKLGPDANELKITN